MKGLYDFKQRPSDYKISERSFRPQVVILDGQRLKPLNVNERSELLSDYFTNAPVLNVLLLP